MFPFCFDTRLTPSVPLTGQILRCQPDRRRCWRAGGSAQDLRFARWRCRCFPLRGCILAAGLLGSLAAGSTARKDQHSAELARQAQPLIEQLADPDYDVREAAQRRLLEIGKPAADLLRRATKSADIEQRLRAEQILRELRRADLWQPSTIQLKLVDAPVLDVFRAIADQSGNPVNWLRSSRSLQTPVSVAWDGAPYWQAIEEASRKGNVVPHWFDDPKRAGAILAHGAVGAYPVAHVGPLRLQLLNAHRLLTDSLNYGDGTNDRQDGLEMNFALQWEQRFALCRYGSKLKLTEARTDAGEDLHIESRVKFGLMHLLRRHRQLMLPVSLRPPTRPAKKLVRIRAEMELVAAGDYETLVVQTTGATTAAHGGGYSLDFLGTKPAGGMRELRFRWTRPYALDAVNVTDLVDENFRILNDAGEEIAFSQHQVLGDRNGVEYVVHVPAKPAAIEGHVALLRSRRVIDFEFRDVPLPGAPP